MDSINMNGGLLAFDEAKIMGILNLTPDSFYDGSKYESTKNAIAQVELMVSQGVDILDIGAASSRPGAKSISSDEEIKRLGNVLREVKIQFPDLVISVDTFHRKVAEFALNNGAHIINDISAWELDSTLLDFIAETKVPYIMMHMKGNPQSMQNNPTYDSVVSEILKFFINKLRLLHERDVKDIIVDPGFGFGKSIQDNYEILGRLSVFKILERPLLVGLSRKSMLYKLLDIKPEESLSASTAIHLQALMNGASILRVHDVKEAKQAVAIHKVLRIYN